MIIKYNYVTESMCGISKVENNFKDLAADKLVY